jgi:hypothetical protein
MDGEEWVIEDSLHGDKERAVAALRHRLSGITNTKQAYSSLKYAQPKERDLQTLLEDDQPSTSLMVNVVPNNDEREHVHDASCWCMPSV